MAPPEIPLTAPRSDPVSLAARNTAEIVTMDELRGLVDHANPEYRRAYVGFEPSGTAHIGYKILANKIHDLQEAGFDVSILLADWHAYINDKMGGSLPAIQAVAKYMEDMFLALGVRPDVRFVYTSSYVSDPAYWETVIRVGKSASLSRIKRAMSIMGRKEEDAEIDYIKTLYPAMQVADIFYNKWHLAYGGLDQRHAHMLARDVADKLGWWKPVAVHTPLLPSLSESGGRMDPIEMKMSKSKPESGIFLHDAPQDVEAKLRSAFCPPKIVEGNPVLALFSEVIFPEVGSVTITRPEKYGGTVRFESFAEFAKAYEAGLHPQDVKRAATQHLNESLARVHQYFEKHPANLAKLQEVRASLPR
ncbi:MAG: tyrosine--tRNA ligase [Thermoplasmatota archaeon]